MEHNNQARAAEHVSELQRTGVLQRFWCRRPRAGHDQDRQELQPDLASTIGIDEEAWAGFFDGCFGPKTDKYVRCFQRSSHLEG